MTAVRTRHLRPEDLRGLRFRGYVRESTERQAERVTPIARQQEEIVRAAEGLGMVPAEPLWYTRVGSGEDRDVPELQVALRDAGQYDVLVLFHTSRLARDQVEAGLLKRRFAEAGVILYFASQHIVAGAYTTGLAEGVSAVIDQFDNETRRMWVAGGQRQRQLSGRWLGAIPVGYRRVLVDRPDGTRGWDGDLEVDPVKAPIIRRIFDEAAASVSTSKIAYGLNADGLRSARGPWSGRSVFEVLSNPVYIGRMIRYRRDRPDRYYGTDTPDGRADLGGRIPAIIGEKLWTDVQQGIRRGHRTGTRTRVYPLTQVLRCAKCGYRMTGICNAAGTRYYRCSGRVLHGVCDAPSVRAESAEGDFAQWIGSYDLPADWRTEIARTKLDRTLADDHNRQVNVEERLKRLRDLYAWGDLPEEEYRRQTAELRASITVIRPEIASLEAVAIALRNLGPVWRSAKPDAQAAVPPLMLKSAEVVDGAVSAWVVKAELQPLLELCTQGRLSSAKRSRVFRAIALRYSA